MPALNVRVDQELWSALEAQKPHFLSSTAYLNLIIHQAIDGGFTLNKPSPASGGPAPAKGGEVLNKEDKERVRALSLEGLPIPPAQGKPVDPALEAHTTLIRDFWRTKKGSKGEQAWKLLQTGLTSIQAAYGDAVVKEQLELAINGRWQSITLANYERFKPAGTTKKVKRMTEEEKEAAHQKRLEEWGLV
jgi:hypothetical protein